MNYIGIDLHKTSSQVCILTQDGELIERRIKTDKESFDKLLADKPRARIQEWECFSLKDLEFVRSPDGKRVERDLNFTPTRFRSLRLK